MPYNASDRLLQIDPATAAIVASRTLAGDRVWTGLTSVPAGVLGPAAVLLGGTGTAPRAP